MDKINAMVEDYLSGKDWRINENSNMDYSLQGFNIHITGAVTAHYWLTKIYPAAIQKLHQDGSIHIHDLSSLSAYCCGWSLEDLLVRGFGGVPGKVVSSPAKHLSTALGQIVNFLYTVQNEAAGAQAFSNFDTLLAPFVAEDDLSFDKIKQLMQEFLFNMNVPTRMGGQTPFSNLTMDLVVPAAYKDQAVIIGGKRTLRTYGEFQKEVDLINRAFCEVMTKGDASGRPFVFPIPTYNLTDDFDWENGNHKYLWDMTAKYGIPYFSNFMNSDLKPEDVTSMCCRLKLNMKEIHKRNGGLFSSAPLTGSIGVVTVNLPRVGYNAEDEHGFFLELDRLMDKAKESLVIKRKIIEEYTENNFYPYLKTYLSEVKEKTGKYWSNHFNTIGIIGMEECLQNYKPINDGILSDAGVEFTAKILNHMRDKLLEYQQETNMLFNLEATPAEGASYRFAREDKHLPGSAHNGTIDPYYTNSTQLPVGATDDLFLALKHQEKIQPLYTGGTVFHTFLGESITDWRACKQLVKMIASNFNLPYFSISPTYSICPEHGFITGEHANCPKCDLTCDIYSRTVGYYSPVRQWNKGKQSEFTDRKMYEI